MPADIWADWHPATATPTDSHIFFGADPAWTPEKEAKTQPHHPNPDRPTCPLCGEEAQAELGGDPIRVYETAVVACGRCMRSTYEGRLRGRVSAPKNEPGMAPADKDDHEDRTGDAVRGPEREDDRPLTRKERRAQQFGEKTAKAG
jgi:hypothetical protein